MAGNPQTIAQKIGKSGCLAMCYLWAVSKRPQGDATYIMDVCAAMETGVIDGECYVKDAEKLLHFYTGKKYKVEKKQVNDLAEIQEKTPVCFRYIDGAGQPWEHWVGVENGRIVFNSLENSKCVEYGRPYSARMIKEG